MSEPTGTKYDAGKPRMGLISDFALFQEARVMEFGARKYSQYGECNCFVKVVNEIEKFGPKDFVNLATKLNYNNLIPKSITTTSENIEEKTLNDFEIGELSIWLRTLISSQLNVEILLREPIIFPIWNWMRYLHNQLVVYVVALHNSVLTTTTEQEKQEQDFVRLVTLHLASLKELSGLLKHNNTCQSLQVIKTGDNNWRGGIKWSRLIDAALRHIHAFNAGEDYDTETGISHLAHARCCLAFLLEFTQTHKELDDRYNFVEAANDAKLREVLTEAGYKEAKEQKKAAPQEPVRAHDVGELPPVGH